MTDILVSIIVPVYNCQDYIKQNIESVIAQTYQSFEVIYVTDGCTDLSTSIIKSYEKVDRRIRLIENGDNKGAAYRRNQGLEISRGEWITFWDADDTYEKTYIWDMVSVIDNDVDFIICNYDIIGCGGRKPFEFNHNSFDFKNVISYAPCNKLVKRQLLINNKIRFQEIPNCNDIYFSITCLLESKKSKYVDKVLWHYRVGQSNNLSTGREKNCYLMEALDAIYEKVNEKEDDTLLMKFSSFAQFNILGYRKFPAFAHMIEKYNKTYKSKWNLDIKLEREFFVSNSSFFDNKKIAIMGTGGVGTDYFTQLTKEGKTIVGCFDNNWKKYCDTKLEAKPVEDIINVDFDVVIIAISDEKLAMQMKNQLCKLNVDDGKIWWKKPEKEN